jgi:hypothetical protein
VKNKQEPTLLLPNGWKDETWTWGQMDSGHELPIFDIHLTEQGVKWLRACVRVCVCVCVRGRRLQIISVFLYSAQETFVNSLNKDNTKHLDWWRNCSPKMPLSRWTPSITKTELLRLQLTTQCSKTVRNAVMSWWYMAKFKKRQEWNVNKSINIPLKKRSYPYLPTKYHQSQHPYEERASTTRTNQVL